MEYSGNEKWGNAPKLSWCWALGQGDCGRDHRARTRSDRPVQGARLHRLRSRASEDIHRQDPEVRLPDSDVRDIGRWPGDNPVLVSNLAVIAISGSVSADLVRNIIF